MTRRKTAAALLVAVALGTIAAGPAGARPGWDREAECRYARWDGRAGWSTQEVRRTIVCAVGKWSVQGGAGAAIAIAACESGLNANASNGGRYLGVYQHAAAYWPARVDAFNPPTWDRPLSRSAFNARSNVVVAIRMAHAGGWGPWSCA
jgi:hypothetical protein